MTAALLAGVALAILPLSSAGATASGWSPPVSVDYPDAASAISCPAKAFCMTAGNKGAGEGYAAAHDSGTWSASVTVDPDGILLSVSCASAGSARPLCGRNGTLLILDEIITGFRWHERGAQFIYRIEPDLCIFGKGLANGLPLSALGGHREVMRLGGYVDDVDRVFMLSQTSGAQPWALAAMLAVIDVYQREGIAQQLHQIGAGLLRSIEKVVGDAGLNSHFQLRGRDCNLVYVARDEEG